MSVKQREIAWNQLKRPEGCKVDHHTMLDFFVGDRTVFFPNQHTHTTKPGQTKARQKMGTWRYRKSQVIARLFLRSESILHYRGWNYHKFGTPRRNLHILCVLSAFTSTGLPAGIHGEKVETNKLVLDGNKFHKGLIWRDCQTCGQ